MRKPPQAAIEEIPKPDVTEMVSSLRQLHDLGMCETDEQLRDRVDAYFNFCEQRGFRPGIESLCMALHISRMTLMRWARGENCSQKRQEIAESAKQFVIAYVEAATLSGRLNPASSCFLMKNLAGYRDNIQIDQPMFVNPVDTLALSRAEIEKRIPIFED